MRKAIPVTADDQAINLVNRHHREVQQREILRKMNHRNKEDAEQKRAEELFTAFLEAAAALGFGGVELVALIGGATSPWLAVPMMIPAFVFAGIRIGWFLKGA